MTTLADVTELIVDSEHKTAPKSDAGYPLVRTSDIKRGRIDLSSVQRVNEETYKKWTKRAVPRAGDLILAREAPVGNVAIVTRGMNPVLGQRTVLLRPDRKYVDSTYLCALLLGDEIQYWMNAVANGATVPHLNMSDIRLLKLTGLPSIEMQQKIGRAVASFDDLIENNLRRIEILEEMPRSLYQEWFVHFRFPGHEDYKLVDSELGLIPEGWQAGSVGDCLSLQRGFDLPVKARQTDGTVPVIAASGPHGFHNEAKVVGPGVTTGRSGTVGVSTHVSGDFWPLNTTLWVKEFKRGASSFSYALLQSLDLNRVAGGAAVPTLNRNHVHAMPHTVPPEDLAIRYEQAMSPAVALKFNLIQQNRVLSEARDLLLPRLVSGELDVSELDLGEVLS